MTINLYKLALCLLILLASLLSVTACTDEQNTNPQPQDTRHDVLMTSTDGKQYALNDYIGKGRWVVVNVWATKCPYCRHELFDLGNFHQKHYLDANAKKDAMVLGLTIKFPEYTLPDKDYIAQFKEDYLIDYPLLLVDQALAEEVIGQPVDMIPQSFFYNPEGKLVYQLKGMVTEEMLEAAIKRKHTDYQTAWAKEVPPEYRPKPGQ